MQASEKAYFTHDQLQAFSEGILRDGSEFNTQSWDLFMNYYGHVLEDGALTVREKRLIALAVANTIGCPYCMEAYTKASLEAGADKDQILETLHVVSAMKAGANLAMGVQMKQLVDKLEM